MWRTNRHQRKTSHGTYVNTENFCLFLKQNYYLLSIFCVLCFCFLYFFFLCTVSPHVYSCLFSICVKVETQLQLINIVSYIVMFYRILFISQGTVNLCWLRQASNSDDRHCHIINTRESKFGGLLFHDKYLQHPVSPKRAVPLQRRVLYTSATESVCKYSSWTLRFWFVGYFIFKWKEIESYTYHGKEIPQESLIPNAKVTVLYQVTESAQSNVLCHHTTRYVCYNVCRARA